MNSGTQVVLVHGLWNRGWCLALMAARLRARGHQVKVFSYPSRKSTLQDHALALHDFVSPINAAELHLVGHSMGGLVVLHMLSRFTDLPMGRVVLIGTPVQGSQVATRLARLPGHRLLLGEIGSDLQRGFALLPTDRDTGMISGTRAIGLGRMTGRRHGPGDGTVGLSETEIAGLADSIELRVAHTEMLVSVEVVAQVEHFLRWGNFKKGG